MYTRIHHAMKWKSSSNFSKTHTHTNVNLFIIICSISFYLYHEQTDKLYNIVYRDLYKQIGIGTEHNVTTVYVPIT